MSSNELLASPATSTAREDTEQSRETEGERTKNEEPPSNLSGANLNSSPEEVAASNPAVTDSSTYLPASKLTTSSDVAGGVTKEGEGQTPSQATNMLGLFKRTWQGSESKVS